MAYVYTGIWFLVGLILITRMGKENKIFYAAGGFFLFLGGWWLADILLEADLMAGPWSWVLRGVSAVMLVILGAFYMKNYRAEQAAIKAEKNREE